MTIKDDRLDPITLVASQKNKEREYWLKKLSGPLTKTTFFYDHRETGGNRQHQREIDVLEFEFPETTSKQMDSLRNGSDRRLHMILVAGLAALLYKYTGSRDIILGIPVLKQAVEMEVKFVNTTLAIRTQVNPTMTFKELLIQVRQAILEATEHQNYPMDVLVEKLGLTFGENHFPLFDIVLLLENIHDPAYIRHTNPNILLIFKRVHEGGFERVLGRVEYNACLYEKSSIRRMITQLTGLLYPVLFKVELLISAIDILSEEEKQQVLVEFNDTSSGYPQDKTVQQLFQQQARKTPDHAAVVYEDHYLTYRKLDTMSDQLAAALRKKGIQGGSIIALLFDWCVDVIAAIMAVLKAWGAYLPIDFLYPTERIEMILKDSHAPLLITSRGLSQREWIFPAEVIEFEWLCNKVDDTEVGVNEGDETEVEVGPGPFSPAYAIYTSGSTGIPKGILVEHHSFTDFCTWAVEEFEHRPGYHVLLSNSYASDGSLQQIFPPLISGGALYLLDPEIRLDVKAYLAYLRSRKINNIDEVPVLMKVIFEHIESIPAGEPEELLPDLTCLSLGSEYVPIEVVKKCRRYFNHDGRIINAYGPAETSVETTTYHFDGRSPKEKSLIGKPRRNLHVYILNSQGECCPIGSPGEICISGVGVARGYINKPELTAEKFFDKTLSSLLLALRKKGRAKNALKERNQPGAFRETRRARNQELRAKIYRSGDQGRWLPDGNIEFIGRVDHQVMIKGHRVEPAEIEKILVSHSLVKNAVVCAGVNERDDSYLVAYVVSQDKGLKTQLEMLLLRKVPLYMVPSYFVFMDQLPLNPNGKVDRRALPEPKHESREEYVPPRNEIEQQLAEVWQEVLGVEDIGIHHHFFEMGGDSIKAIQVSARLYKHRLKLNLRDLFLYPTIMQLAPYIEKTNRQANQGIVQGEVPLTPIQEEFFARHSNHRRHFNLAVMLYREEGFDENIVRKSITKLVKHHDALRMIYPGKSGNVHQINRGIEGELFSLEIINIEDLNNLESWVEIEAQRIQESIDLAAGPLVKTGLFNTPRGGHLLIVIHHLVVDGVSWRILLEDFAAAYQQAARGEEIQLPEKTDSFKYWAAKLGESSVIKKFLKELDHWKQLETAEIGLIPQGSPIKKEDKIYKNLESVYFNLDPAETGTLLTGVHHAYGTEINDILLTGLGLAVKQWAHINTFLINLEGHGREPIAEDVNINRTIGWFTSQYPVILDIKSSADLSYTIKQVKETLRKIPNKGIGYGILKYAHLADEKQEPKISFNYLGQFDRESAHTNSHTNRDRDDSEPFTISPLKSGNAVSPGLETEYDLDIVGMVVGGQLVTSISYNKFQYDRSAMEQLAGYYKESLWELIRHCKAKKEKELTPSDFTKKDIEMSELEKIMDIVAEI